MKSISTGQPELGSHPISPLTKKLIRETAKMYYALKLRSQKVTTLPHFKVQVDFFSKQGEAEFYKAIGKCILGENKKLIKKAGKKKIKK